jgi:uncharacterized protein YjbI with pentapeptide repeats
MTRLVWLTKRRFLISGIAVLIVIGTISSLSNVRWLSWTGFGEDAITSKSEERDQQGNLTKTITTTTPQSAKTLWDWLSVLGVPFSLAILGFWLQQLQQKRAEQQTRLERERIEQQEKAEKERAEQQANLEKEIAEANQREEALQAYFDRLSTLLVDKNLIAIATKLENSKDISTNVQNQSSIDEQKELFDAAVGVVQARTLSILRRLKEDGERKTSVIRFLIEAKVISKLKLDFSGAYLNDTDLSRGNFHGINFIGANLNGADLSGANLRKANFSNADLSNANLRGADLTDSSFDGANLSGAYLTFANLDGANFSNANFSDADLSRVQLRGTVKRDKNSHFAVHHSATIFREANFQRASFRDAKFFDAILCNANLKFTDLSNANFSGANLLDADLSPANLSNAAFRKANLSGANLSNVNLRNADLSGAKLRGANLNNANLTGADFTGANLGGLSTGDIGDFSSAIFGSLSVNHWDGADLTTSQNWTEEQLKSAKLCKTKLPQGCSLDPDRDCAELGILENQAD